MSLFHYKIATCTSNACEIIDFACVFVVVFAISVFVHQLVHMRRPEGIGLSGCRESVASWSHLVAFGRELVAFGRIWSRVGRELVAFGRSWSQVGRELVAFGRSWSRVGRGLVANWSRTGRELVVSWSQ